MAKKSEKSGAFWKISIVKPRFLDAFLPWPKIRWSHAWLTWPCWQSWHCPWLSILPSGHFLDPAFLWPLFRKILSELTGGYCRKDLLKTAACFSALICRFPGTGCGHRTRPRNQTRELFSGNGFDHLTFRRLGNIWCGLQKHRHQRRPDRAKTQPDCFYFPKSSFFNQVHLLKYCDFSSNKLAISCSL